MSNRGKNQPPTDLPAYEPCSDADVSSFEALHTALRSHPELVREGPNVLNATCLAKIVSGIRRFQDLHLGRHAKNQHWPLVRIPDSIFRDRSRSGPLFTALLSAYRQKSSSPWRNFDFSSPKRVGDNVSLLRRMEMDLIAGGHLKRPVVYFDETVTGEMRVSLGEIVEKFGGSVVESWTDATHVVAYDPEVDNEELVAEEERKEDENVEREKLYLRTVAIVDPSAPSGMHDLKGSADHPMALVHWWYWPASYDEWMPAVDVAGDVQDDPNPRPAGGGPWVMSCKFVRDVEAFNEWGVEADYAIIDFQKKVALYKTTETKKATSKSKKSSKKGSKSSSRSPKRDTAATLDADASTAGSADPLSVDTLSQTTTLTRSRTPPPPKLPTIPTEDSSRKRRDRRAGTGLNPRSIVTGLYGARGERIRRIVYDGALRVPSGASEIIRDAIEEGRARLSHIGGDGDGEAQGKSYELPGFDAVVRPSLDSSLGPTILVTEMFASTPTGPGGVVKTIASNRMVGIASPVVEDEAQRIRGGGGDEEWVPGDEDGVGAAAVGGGGVLNVEQSAGTQGGGEGDTSNMDIEAPVAPLSVDGANWAEATDMPHAGTSPLLELNAMVDAPSTSVAASALPQLTETVDAQRPVGLTNAESATAPTAAQEGGEHISKLGVDNPTSSQLGVTPAAGGDEIGSESMTIENPAGRPTHLCDTTFARPVALGATESMESVVVPVALASASPPTEAAGREGEINTPVSAAAGASALSTVVDVDSPLPSQPVAMAGTSADALPGHIASRTLSQQPIDSAVRNAKAESETAPLPLTTVIQERTIGSSSSTNPFSNSPAPPVASATKLPGQSVPTVAPGMISGGNRSIGKVLPGMPKPQAATPTAVPSIASSVVPTGGKTPSGVAPPTGGGNRSIGKVLPGIPQPQAAPSSAPPASGSAMPTGGNRSIGKVLPPTSDATTTGTAPGGNHSIGKVLPPHRVGSSSAPAADSAPAPPSPSSAATAVSKPPAGAQARPPSVVPLPKRPLPQWKAPQHHHPPTTFPPNVAPPPGVSPAAAAIAAGTAPSANATESSTTINEPHGPTPPWYNPRTVSAHERTLLPEWFDGSSSHRTITSYISSRETVLSMSRESHGKYITKTAVRRNVVGDAGSLMRLHDFLMAEGMINGEASGDSAPMVPGLRVDGSTRGGSHSSAGMAASTTQQSFWTAEKREALVNAVVSHSNKRRKLHADDSAFEPEDSNSNVVTPLDWDDVANQVGPDVDPLDCQREFLSLPLDDQEKMKSILVPLDNGTNEGSKANVMSPKSEGETNVSGEGTRALSSSMSYRQLREEIFRNLVDGTSPTVVAAATNAALAATPNVAEAQRAGLLGAIASQALEKAQAEENTIERLLLEILDQRMLKLENRLAGLDDLEGMLEAERVSLELERRDLYTARCRHWFGGGA